MAQRCAAGQQLVTRAHGPPSCVGTPSPISQVNVRGDLPPAMRQRHPNAPARLQWVSGVLLPPGVKLGNGTWSPRYNW